MESQNNQPLALINVSGFFVSAHDLAHIFYRMILFPELYIPVLRTFYGLGKTLFLSRLRGAAALNVFK